MGISHTGVADRALIRRRVDRNPDRTALPGGTRLWLRLVGEFTVYRAGQAVPTAAVGSRKGRILLALLAIHHGKRLPVDQIVEALWEDPPQQPVENVATLVSRLRTALGTHVVAGGRSGYRLGETARVDLHVAAALVAQAEARLKGRQPDQALSTARRAIYLLDDTLAIPDHTPWADPAYRLHAEVLRRARHAAAEAALGTGQAPAAQVAAAAAISADPLDEAAYRLLMRAHDAAGEPARALAAYQRLRVTLSTELGIDPATPSRDLHAAILRRNAAGR